MNPAVSEVAHVWQRDRKVFLDQHIKYGGNILRGFTDSFVSAPNVEECAAFELRLELRNEELEVYYGNVYLDSIPWHQIKEKGA